MRLNYRSSHSHTHPGWPIVTEKLLVSSGIVRLRPVHLKDGGEWSRLRRADQELLEPWEIDTGIDWEIRHSPWKWFVLCRDMQKEANSGRLLPFVIEVNGQFGGQLTVGNITHGALRSAWIGYWVYSAMTGGGVATAAVALGIDHCFAHVGLHRLEATVRPENGASQAVLHKAGFRQEGLLQRYLYVDNAWRDHMLFAITNTEIPDTAVGSLIKRGKAQRI